MMRIKTGRSVQVETVCDFSEAEQQIQKVNNLFSTKPLRQLSYGICSPDLFNFTSLVTLNSGTRIFRTKINM